MKYLIRFSLVIFLLIFSVNAFSYSSDSIGFEAIEFISDNVGFTAGDGKIWKTEDGGNKWSIVFKDRNYNFLDLDSFHHFFIFNKETIYAVSLKKILVSHDRGNHWETDYKIKSGDNNFFLSKPVIDDQGNIYFASLNKIIVNKTLNNEWKEIYWQPPDNPISSIFWISNNIFVATQKGIIFKKNSNRTEWIKVGYCNFEIKDYYNVKYKVFYQSTFFQILPSGIGYAANLAGGVLKTENSGKTWKMVRDFITNHIKEENHLQQSPDIEMSFQSALVFDENSVFFLTINGELIYTKDGGISWFKAKVLKSNGKKTNSNLRFISMIDEKRGFITASPGILFKTEDGGKTWNEVKYKIISNE